MPASGVKTEIWGKDKSKKNKKNRVRGYRSGVERAFVLVPVTQGFGSENQLLGGDAKSNDPGRGFGYTITQESIRQPHPGFA